MTLDTVVSPKDFEELKTNHLRLWKIIIGNGEVGMDEKLRYVYTWVKGREKRAQAFTNALTIFAATTLITGAINAFIFFGRVIPLLESIQSATPTP